MEDLTEFVALDRTLGSIDLPDSVPLQFEKIEFRNVRFKYPTSTEYIIDNLSFELHKNMRYTH